ncbi:aspartate/glutamate racemase family protein [Butyricicoccus sp.]|uniref:aspartate/glutamate racemase family protein n=1 Tax=Butyricicoccus sp. TaxID=2049021 RepID=UPI003F152C8F
MRKVGLVGGTGPESTVMYYRDINYGIYEKTKGRAFPELSIESVNLYHAVQYCQDQSYEELTAYLLQAVCHLAESGAEFAALTANTVHIVFDEVNRQSPIPLVSIVEAACEQAKRRKLKRVGLLGTIFTMKGNFYQETFSREGIEILTPSDREMELVNDRIANELELGIVKETTRQELIQVIRDMQQREKIEAVILGCTELPLALTDEICPVPCLDTTKIHIETLIEMMMQ